MRSPEYNILNVNLEKIICESLFNVNGLKDDFVSNPAISLNPLLVNRQYLLLDGYKRFYDLKKMKKKSVDVILLNNIYIPSESLYYRYISMNISGEMNILQKISLYHFLILNESEPEKLSEWQKILNLPTNKSELSKISTTILDWPDHAKRYIQKYNLSHNQVKPILKVKNPDVKTLFKLGLELQIRAVELLQIFDIVNEIAIDKNQSITQLFAAEPFKTLIKNENQNRSQKLNLLKNHLFKLRYPVINKSQMEMDQLIRELKLSDKINIKFDRFFERDGLQIKLNINNHENFNRTLQILQDTKNSYIFKKIFNKI